MHVLFHRGSSRSIMVRFELDGKQRLLERPAGETLDRTLQRMARLQLSREAKKQLQREARTTAKTEGRSMQECMEELMGRLPSARVLDEDERDLGESAADTQSVDALMRAVAVELGGTRYRVIQNPPTVNSIAADTRRPLAGFPLLPRADLVNCSSDHCLWAWSARRAGAGDSAEWQPVGEGQTLTPGADLVGCRLRCSCTPRRLEGEHGLHAADGVPATVEYDGAVEAAAESVLTSALSAYAAAHGGGGASRLRLASYNILADVYACTRFAREHMFPYCAPQHLDEEYRKPHLVHQIAALRADVVALQEVGTAFYERYLAPHARRSGLEGVHAEKAGAVSEGVALLFRPDRFRLLAHVPVSLNDRHGRALRTECVCLAPDPRAGGGGDVGAGGGEAGLGTRMQRELEGSEAELAARWRAHPALAEAMRRVTTVGQVVLLEETRGVNPRRLCVANTHLFFHSGAMHIRALQTAMLVRAAKRVADAAGGAALVVAGDLNALPNTAAQQLLSRGVVEDSHRDWDCGATFYWGAAKVKPPPAAQAAQETGKEAEKEEEVQEEEDTVTGEAEEGGEEDSAANEARRKRARVGASGGADETPLRLRLECPVPLFSACGEQPYTTMVNGFEGRLDYVMCQSDAFRAEACFDALPRSTVAAEGGLPSQQFPSDHLPQVADVEWVGTP